MVSEKFFSDIKPLNQNKGKRECDHRYELSMREAVGLLKESEKGSAEMFRAFVKCYHAGFGAGVRKSKAEQKRA